MRRSGRFAGPLAHGLLAGTIDVNRVVDPRHPGQGYVVMLAAVVLGKLDGAVVARQMIDGGELAALGADDGHVRFDVSGVGHVALTEHEACPHLAGSRRRVALHR